MLTQNEIDALIARIAYDLRPHRIVVFGSYAKGTATSRSDLDMLIVLDTAMPERHRHKLIAPLVAGYSVHVDAHVATPGELAAKGGVRHSFMDAVNRTGRVVFDRERDST